MIFKTNCIMGEKAHFSFVYDDSILYLVGFEIYNTGNDPLTIRIFEPRNVAININPKQERIIDISAVNQRMKYELVESGKEPGVYLISGIEWQANHTLAKAKNGGISN